MSAETTTPLNARYDGRWYFCWLIERREGPQPTWLGEYSWETDANKAIWYARKSDADATVTHQLKGNSKMVVCEHGFDLGAEAPSNSHAQLLADNARLREALSSAESIASDHRGYGEH